jgi:SAM-dependent methyltransferase
LFVLFYFALTLFTSATLLFFVQPMIGKMILPRLGGTPAVWNTCMVFFQAVLLFGYGYTHLVSTKLSRRGQLILQSLLLLTPFALLPFSLGSWTPPEESNPIFSVLGILAIVVGVPFFVVSTSAPLLQKWFAFTGHPSSQDPYFLYGASNLGSMLALVLYPLAMEPNFSLEPQTWIWTWGYGFFVLLVLGCVALLWTKTAPAAQLATEPLPVQPSVPAEAAIVPASRTRRSRIATADIDSPKLAIQKSSEITWGRRLRWIALAAIPSSLMLGCTTYMTTDIAAIPFFWVMPLALYLMTFIFVFARWPVVWTAKDTKPPTPLRTQWGVLIMGVAGMLIASGIFMHFFVEGYESPLNAGWPHVLYLLAFFLFFVFWIVTGAGGPHDFVLYFQPCFLLFLVLKFVAPHIAPRTWLEFSLHLFSFFFITLMCHGELASDRPSSKHLTEFYLWMSVGGVLGGIFNALFAPLLFRFGVLEYPLAMVLACFLRPNLTNESTLFPGDSSKGEPTPLGYALDIIVPITLVAVAFACVKLGETIGYRDILIAVPIVGVLALAMRPLRFGLALSLVWMFFALKDQGHYEYVFQDRGFFGLVKVKKNTDDGTEAVYHTLIHGGIDHGRQHVDPKRRHEPAAYFHPLTGIGQVFMKMTWPNTPLPASIKDFNETPNPYHTFTLPNWRFPTGLIGLGNDSLSSLVALHSEPPYAVVGLGTGTLAAYAKPYQPVHMYEIDPLVYRLSQKVNEEEPPFTYLIDAEARGANLKVILGDGRLKIEKAPELWYHIICLDAFSSDAIPTHLLTIEAIEIYLKKLAPGGVLIFNTTNRYVEIAGVLKDAADHLDLECWYLSDWYVDATPEKYATDFVILRRSEAAIAKLDKTFNGGPSLPDRLDRENWASLVKSMEASYKKRYGERFDMEQVPWKQPKNGDGHLWTDRYSNLLGVLRLWR